MEEEDEWRKLPCEDRVAHKLWKARVNGYEEAKKLFAQWDEDDPKWKNYQGLAKKMVVDSNAVAQEKGLECCLAFAENCKTAPKTAGEVIEGIVTKCVAAPKTKTKELASQIILMYCEIEAHEKVVEGLLAGFPNKNPKVASGCVMNVTQCLRAFGAKVVKVSPLLKAVVPLMDHRDKDVRGQGKGLIIESYRWIGEVMKSQLTGLKPVQLTELDTEFANLEGVGKAKPERWLRSAGPPKEVVKEAAGDDGDEEDDDDDSEDASLDPYELLDPVEILSKLPKNFFEQVEEKKWQLRKESLDALLPLTQNPKLQPGDYHELVKVLKKFIAKDTNVMLVALAAQCFTGLAKGLRNHFKQLANNSLSTLLEKFKEKKLNVVTSLRDAVDAIYPILGVEAIQEDCLATLKHKTPPVRAETASFLNRCFAKCPPILLTNKKILKGYVSALLETLNESDPGVREAAAEALGALWKFLGEGKVMPFMPDLDKLKLDKIKEKAEKIELTGKSAAPKPKKEAPAAKSAPGPRVVKPEAAAEPPPKAKAGPPSKAKPGKVVKSGGAKKAGGGSAPKTGGGSAGPPPGGVASESDLTLEECEMRAGEVFNEAIVTGLADSNWKNRLASIEEAKGRLDSSSEFPGLVAVKLLCKKPGLKDNNFQVLGHKLVALKTIVTKVPLTQQMWDSVTPDIVDKLADKKNMEACKETLYAMAESASFNFVFGGVLDLAFSQKSPIVKSEALGWAGEGIKLFGFGGLQPRPALECIKKGLAETNPAVRTASIGLLGVLHWYMGATAKRMFEDEKPAMLTQIEAECDKYKGQALPIPCRGVKARSSGGGDAEEEEFEAEAPMEDLVPRQDISTKVTDEICDMLKDKNWKIRKEGLDKVKDIVSSAKFITSDLGSLPASLAPRTTDSNKNLAIQALEMIGDLSLAMGPHTKFNIPHLLPAVLGGLADSKPNVRAAALASLNHMLKETSLRDMMVGDIFGTALGKANPFMKQEIFNWLSSSLMEAKGLSKEDLTGCLPVLFASVEDRSGDVRKAAQEAVLGFMKNLGFEAMRKATDKLSAVSKNTVSPLLDKARAELPPPKAAAAAPKKAGSAPPAREPKATREPSETRPVTAEAGGRKESATTKPGGKAGVKSRLGAGATSRKKEEEVDSSPPYTANKLKNGRFRDEAKLKLLKWNFATPRAEFVDQLKEQLVAANFNKSLMAMMFHADFKQHLKALEMMIGCVDSDIEALISNLDLLLKWCTLRFFETNPSVNIKGLEYLNMVFNTLTDSEDGYNLHDIEANCFIPYLINKIGDPKDQIRASCKSILKMLCKLYPASKLFTFVLAGIGTKNAKQRTECLEEIGCLIASHGTGVCGSKPSDVLKEMAKQIAERDTSVRNAALNAITEAYFQEGERTYKMIGNLPEKDMAMLEERIKRASKTRQVANQHNAAPPVMEQPPEPKVNNRNIAKPGGLRPPSASSAGAARDNGTESEVKMRYQAARAQSAGGGGAALPRPVSGAFTLDLDKIEGRSGLDRGMTDSGPKLVEHDLEDIINSEPVMLPVTRTGMQHRMGSPETNGSSGSGRGMMSNNQEAYQTINAVIAQVFNTDTQTSITALSQLEELMKDNEKVELLGPCIDHLFSMCCMQYRFVLETKMKVDNANGKEVMRLLQYLTMVLMSLYGHRDLVKKATMQVLHDLINVIVLILLEPSVTELPEGGQLVRALNVITVKIVDRSDHNAVSSALIKLLHECIGSSVLSSKYCVLVMKCIWKVIRGLPSWLDQMDVSLLLADLHSFLISYPGSYWKQQSDDTPMRTVKTVIHTLVKCKGESVLNCLGRVGDQGGSELVPYIRKLLNSGVGSESGTTGGSAGVTGGSNLPVVRGTPQEKKKMPRFTKSDHEALVEIFKKIGQKDLTKVGLQELYNFKVENPHVDLEPFLAQSSQYFRDYIERGLKKIEEEVTGGGRDVGSMSGIPAPGSMGGGLARHSVLQDNVQGGGQPQHLVYLERLKRLRAAGGLSEPADQENVENFASSLKDRVGQHPTSASSGYSTGGQGTGYSTSRTQSGVSNLRYSREVENIDNNQEENQNNAAPNVDDIRKRLAKIKAQAF